MSNGATRKERPKSGIAYALGLASMPDLILGAMRPSDPATTLAKAADKLGVIAYCRICDALHPEAMPCEQWRLDEIAKRAHDNAPVIQVGRFVLRQIDDETTEIMNNGEGGHFSTAELAEVIGRFVGDRL